MPKLEMQLINPTAIQKYKNYAERGLELSPIKKLTTSSEIKLHVEELKRFVEFLENGNVNKETLAHFNQAAKEICSITQKQKIPECLEKISKEINSNPELTKQYKEYLSKAYSNAQKAYYKLP
jgi:hypothetical protein